MGAFDTPNDELQLPFLVNSKASFYLVTLVSELFGKFFLLCTTFPSNLKYAPNRALFYEHACKLVRKSHTKPTKIVNSRYSFKQEQICLN